MTKSHRLNPGYEEYVPQINFILTYISSITNIIENMCNSNNLNILIIKYSYAKKKFWYLHFMASRSSAVSEPSGITSENVY